MTGIDLEFAKRIERAEREGLRDALAHGREAFPDRGIAIARVADATIGYAGVDSAFSVATGIGIDATVCDADIEEIVEFFHSRGCAARVITAPIAGEQVARKLAHRGFEIDAYEDALAADLTQVNGLRDARIDICSEPIAWANHSAVAFTDDAVPTEALYFVSTIIASHPNVCALALREHGEIQTTGCVAVDSDNVAVLFGTATSPAARGRGFQSAMIADRIARAVEGGATLARATAKIGSVSERNFRRLGFSVLYTRTVWSLKSD